MTDFMRAAELTPEVAAEIDANSAITHGGKY